MTLAEAAVAVAQSISDPIFLVDLQGRLTGANSAGAGLLGTPSAPLAGLPLSDFVDENPEELLNKLGQWARSIEPVPAALALRSAGGYPLEFEAAGLAAPFAEPVVLIRGREHRPAAHAVRELEEKIQALGNEVRQRQQIEQALRESEQRFRGIFENASDAILIADDNALIVEANPAACELLGRTMEDLANTRVMDLAPRQFAEAATGAWSEFLRTGIQHGLFTLERPDGSSRDTEYNAVRGFLEGRHLSILRDVTERQHASAELERQARALERSNAELEQFAYIASHDLQEPLRTIASFVQLTQRRLGSTLDSETAEYMSVVLDGVHRLQRVILDLLEFSRLGTTERHISGVDLNETIHYIRGTLRSRMDESGGTISVERLPVVEGDATQLYQLFLNLIGNALKFRRGTPEVHVSAEPAGEEWLISVRDNGPGIAPEYFARIFEPFRRLHGREIPGSGIGLAICKRVVENHKGRIWVESELDSGSTFFVALPRHATQDRSHA